MQVRVRREVETLLRKGLLMPVEIQPIEQFDLVIGGFRQSPYEPTGVDDLWMRLRTLATDTRCVEILSWDEDWCAIARWVRRVGSESPVIRVYAYSWGVGHGTVQLARQLRKLGLRIAHVVSADGVYRSRLLPAWLPVNVVSLMSWPQITVPSNVDRVDWSYQRLDKPAGHRIVAEDRTQTQISRGIQRHVGHLRMDEDRWWIARSWEVAEQASEVAA